MRRHEGSTRARTSGLPLASIGGGLRAPSTIVHPLPRRTAYASPTLQPAPPSRARDRKITGRRNVVPPLELAVDAPAIALNHAGTLVTPPRVVGSLVRSIATPQPGFGRRALSPALADRAARLEPARPHSSPGFGPARVDLQGHDWCRSAAERPRTPPGERSAQAGGRDLGYSIEMVFDSTGLPTRRLCILQRCSPSDQQRPPSPLAELAANRIFETTIHRHAHIHHRQESMRKLLGADGHAASACLIPSRALSPTVLVQLPRPLEAASMMSSPEPRLSRLSSQQHFFTPATGSAARAQACS